MTVTESNVSTQDTKTAWAEVAYEVLRRVAGRYRKTIAYGELAEIVETESGVPKGATTRQWLSDVLDLVCRECQFRNEPLLTALCVSKDTGEVGPGYAAAVEAMYGEVPADLEVHASEERFKCYLSFGATLPADGGRPALTPQVDRRRKLQRNKANAARVRPTCDTCFVQLPRTGQCDSCTN